MCEYNDATRLECSRALCDGMGYFGGTFVDASNNFCTSQYTSGSVYKYNVDSKAVEKDTYGNNAMITADCDVPGESICFLTLSFH